MLLKNSLLRILGIVDLSGRPSGLPNNPHSRKFPTHLQLARAGERGACSVRKWLRITNWIASTQEEKKVRSHV